MSSTDSPRSRKYSAIAVAVFGASRRIIGLSSPVETTATVDARPSANVSRNSRTSRPRSPTSPMTTVSICGARPSIASNDDLPTPEPANTPMRCPRHSGVKRSTTRTPVRIGAETRARRNGGGGSLSSGAGLSPWASSPAPSTGRPRASMTRPFHVGSGDSERASVRRARVPMAASQRASKGFKVADASSILTTSPICTQSPTLTLTHSPNLRKRDRPATRYWDAETSMIRPLTRAPFKFRKPHETRRSRRSSGETAGTPANRSLTKRTRAS